MTEPNVIERRNRHERERDRSTFKQFLRLPDVEAFSGLRRTQIYRHIRAREFPKPVPITDSGAAVAWDLDELREWRVRRLAARDAQPVSDPARPKSALLNRPRKGASR